MSIRRVLAIETSCDDTSVAVVEGDLVLALQSSAQDKAHAPFGGIVPEVAGRNHYETLLPLVDEVVSALPGQWGDIDALVVTNRPGLLGSLLVGVVTVKALAHAKGLPFLGVNHLEGHIWAPFLRDGDYHLTEGFKPPFVSLAVSGGHTSLYLVRGLGDYEILGTTRDDAAGEAFDKFAKMLGLGFPGGVQVDRLATKGDPQKYSFPQGLREEGVLDFSFSGLKSAGQRLIDSLTPQEKRENIHHLCASFQEAIVSSLISKLSQAALKHGVTCISVTGGVSANSRLRFLAGELARKENLKLAIPPVKFCTDNAAMIGYVGFQRLLRGERHLQTMGPNPAVTGLE